MTEESPRVRVAALVTQGDALLLVKHAKSETDQYWLVPGGGLHYGESMEEAALRELREEVCLTEVTLGGVAFAHDTIAPDSTRHVVNLYFAVTAWDGTPAVGEDPVVDEVAFVPFAEIAALRMYPAVNTALLDWIGNGRGAEARYHGRLWVER